MMMFAVRRFTGPSMPSRRFPSSRSTLPGSMPLSSRLCRTSDRTGGSRSLARTLAAPNLTAAMARMPDPVPMSAPSASSRESFFHQGEHDLGALVVACAEGGAG